MRIFIGYDPAEITAFHVLSHSLIARASMPISITALNRRQLFPHYYDRLRGETESTEFSMTRFLVPFLSGYSGWSVFMDCDMVCLDDILKLEKLAESQPHSAVLACKHDYTPKTDRKFFNQVQTTYARKNWSSLMMFNNDLCRRLTPHYVSTASGLDLHRFAWLEDVQIGEIPLEWNWLVGEYPYKENISMAHFTLGGPYLQESAGCDYASEWWREYRAMDQTVRWRMNALERVVRDIHYQVAM